MKFNLKIVAATAAVAMMSSGAAYAGTVTVTGSPNYYSKEGLTLSGTTAVTLPVITVQFGNNLTQNDDIFITIPGVTPIASSSSAVACSFGGSAVGYVNTVPGGWNFRITAVGGAVTGDTCTFTGLQVQGASLVSSQDTINYRASIFQNPAAVVDSGSNTTGIQVISQFSITPNQKLNGVIDVYKDRLAFTIAESVAPGSGATNPDRADTLNYTISVDGNGTTFFPTSPVVTTTAQVLTITGDFGWVDSGDAGTTCQSSELTGRIVGYADFTPTIDLACSVVTLTKTANVAVGAPHTGYFLVSGTTILNPTDYVGSAVWTYTGSSTTGNTGLAWDPGAWTINGAQVYIQYMPFGANISRIIYAANTGLINADATADIYYNGSITKCALGLIASRTVNELSGPVNACAATALGSATSGKVAILLTFTAPDKDIEVYSAYNVGGNDRGTVVNTSNGRTFFYGTGFPFVPGP
jgi:hypothetical protein